MESPTQLSPTLQLAIELINRESVTPEDAGCQQIMVDRLETTGFKIQHLRFGDVDNFWAIHGKEGPILCFAGHTDVVPTGPASHWQNPPFSATIKDGVLYGRGAADMKGSLAAMVTACERFTQQHPNHKGRIAFLITSDEEGIAINGTVKVMEWLEHNNEKISWCIVGEPSSSETLGDVVKNGRRGSLGCELTVKGVQGHVAYPQLALNPIHAIAPALTQLTTEVWDEGNEYFPATSFQISNINAGTGATNVIPGELKIIFNFRFSTETTEQDLISRTESILKSNKLNYAIDWKLSGLPFITDQGELIEATVAAIKEISNVTTTLSTAGGTSDGRFIAPTGSQLVELGPVNKTIHQVNEHIDASELDSLTLIYEKIMKNLLV